jgi:drug/metabolite transporter (DMT)-like permease
MASPRSACWRFAPILGQTWVMPTLPGLGIILCAVVFLIGAYLSSVEFMRYGDISVIAPFRYVVIAMAIVIGFIVWGEVPDFLMLLGTGIIAATGVYTFSRERNLARRRAVAGAGEGLGPRPVHTAWILADGILDRARPPDLYPA